MTDNNPLAGDSEQSPNENESRSESERTNIPDTPSGELDDPLISEEDFAFIEGEEEEAIDAEDDGMEPGDERVETDDFEIAGDTAEEIMLGEPGEDASFGGEEFTEIEEDEEIAEGEPGDDAMVGNTVLDDVSGTSSEVTIEE